MLFSLRHCTGSKLALKYSPQYIMSGSELQYCKNTFYCPLMLLWAVSLQLL